uniref:R3H-associated N-terminal domain-containing protein n=1 Tax=Triticum urartu TaxID=4572 RepID=A0A8R7U664_TRIUA
MATAGLLRREKEQFGSSPFTGQTTIESKIQALEDHIGATKVSNRRSCRWLNDRLLLELVPRLGADEIKGLFAPPPWGEELPLSAFCMTSSAAAWDVFRTIDMDVQANLLQFHMRQSCADRKNSRLDEDEEIALNAWHRIGRQTREVIKRNFLPDLLRMYEERVRAFIQDTRDLLALDVQDPFQRLLLHGVCEFYNVAGAAP